MCGIGGILRFDGAPIQAGTLSRMLDNLQHRGRDSVGMVQGSAKGWGERMLSRRAEVGLMHRRLSIIDLSDAAAQPMSYAEGKLWITYNGEVYNYIELRNDLKKLGYEFRTSSDTEVILAAYSQWGESCVDYLNGMFSFALWDEEHQKLFCGRDHAGIKPFYYVHTPNFFSFASESSALAHMVEKTLDRDAIAAYFFCMYVPGTWSIFKGIKKLAPGYTLTVKSDGATAMRRFWKIEQFNRPGGKSEYRLQVTHALSGAVARQLRSDVPVGAFLSGGVDSGLVVALAANEGVKLHTFSVGYEGHTGDELPYARQVAKKYNTIHHELKLTASEIVPNLNRALHALNEPIADSAIVPTFMLCEMAAHEGVKVLMNGTGGDEVFGGYDRYIARNWQRYLFEKIPYGVRGLIGDLLPSKYTTLSARLRYLGIDLMCSTAGSASLAERFLRGEHDYSSFIKRLAEETCTPRKKDIPLLHAKMLFDLNVYLTDELLPLLDQMTMAWTLEGRVPFLDGEVMRESFRIPAAYHVRNGRTKILLRTIAASYLGEEYVMRKKSGFGGPVTFWVNQNLNAMLEVVSHARQIPCVEDLNIDRYYRKSRKEISGALANDIFLLYCFIIWHERLKNI